MRDFFGVSLFGPATPCRGCSAFSTNTPAPAADTFGTGARGLPELRTTRSCVSSLFLADPRWWYPGHFSVQVRALSIYAHRDGCRLGYPAGGAVRRVTRWRVGGSTLGGGWVVPLFP